MPPERTTLRIILLSINLAAQVARRRKLDNFLCRYGLNLINTFICIVVLMLRLVYNGKGTKPIYWNTRNGRFS